MPSRTRSMASKSPQYESQQSPNSRNRGRGRKYTPSKSQKSKGAKKEKEKESTMATKVGKLKNKGKATGTKKAKQERKKSLAEKVTRSTRKLPAKEKQRPEGERDESHNHTRGRSNTPQAASPRRHGTDTKEDHSQRSFTSQPSPSHIYDNVSIGTTVADTEDEGRSPGHESKTASTGTTVADTEEESSAPEGYDPVKGKNYRFWRHKRGGARCIHSQETFDHVLYDKKDIGFLKSLAGSHQTLDKHDGLRDAYHYYLPQLKLAAPHGGWDLTRPEERAT